MTFSAIRTHHLVSLIKLALAMATRTDSGSTLNNSSSYVCAKASRKNFCSIDSVFVRLSDGSTPYIVQAFCRAAAIIKGRLPRFPNHRTTKNTNQATTAVLFNGLAKRLLTPSDVWAKSTTIRVSGAINSLPQKKKKPLSIPASAPRKADNPLLTPFYHLQYSTYLLMAANDSWTFKSPNNGKKTTPFTFRVTQNKSEPCPVLISNF